MLIHCYQQRNEGRCDKLYVTSL